MSTSWSDLRSWGKDNSQNAAFEALCCQLGEYEQVPSGAKFFRKAAPDAGLECYWIFPNAEEWGWQAKFFRSVPGESQWKQIDDSIETALKKHPKLSRLTIALPLDRQDPRLEKENWFKDQWDHHVTKWTGWATKENRAVTFDYWGEHEIFERLSRVQHAGRAKFWFDKELFTASWFEKRWKVAVASAGPRYSPELNIELPISGVLDGLGKSQRFEDRISFLEADLRKRRRTIERELTQSGVALIQQPFDNLKTGLRNLSSAFDQIKGLTDDREAFAKAVASAAEAYEQARECSRVFEAAIGSKETSKPQSSEAELFGRGSRQFAQLSFALSEVMSFLEAPEAQSALRRALLMRGEAGTGKTHLFCDVARQRLGQSLPTVLLLGQTFTSTAQPWTQILDLLDFTGTVEEFLGALDAAAQASHRRAVILIDALNEGEGRKLWPAHLSAVLESIARYPRLAIAVSIRSSYEHGVIPDGLLDEKLVVVEHEGFGSLVYEATEAFLNYYGIASPNVPLLNPEFNNPLFLKLLCDGLKKSGRTEIPLGFHGVTQVFEFFVKSINLKLAREGLFHEKLNLVGRAAESLADAMTGAGMRWLALEQAQQVIDKVLPLQNYQNSLFRHLLVEGFLVEGRAWNSDSDRWEDTIAFAYERLADHLIAAFLLKKHLATGAVEDAFRDAKKLQWIVADQQASQRHRGLLEALCVQLPENTDKELPDVVGEARDWRAVRDAFVDAIAWRTPASIREATFTYVNQVVLRYESSRQEFIRALVTVAANPEHKLNADFLHRNLARQDMPSRDAFWSVIIHKDFHEGSPIHRLVEWAWRGDDKSNLSDDSVYLAALALTWFFTTSNRFLRDCATKAWVALIADRIHVVPKLLEAFREVDDPYVIERLLGATYGAVCRNPESEHLASVAMHVYAWIFQTGNPPVHVLSRDYARNIVELALHRSCQLSIDEKLIRPPYRSVWPNMNVPTEAELSKTFDWRNIKKDEERGRLRIHSSALGMGDFARYVVEGKVGRWSSQPRNKPRRPSIDETKTMFVRSLNTHQRELWRILKGILAQERMALVLQRAGSATDPLVPPGASPKESVVREFVALLDEQSRKLFTETILPAEEGSLSERDEEMDAAFVKRWIVQRVLDLGWTVDRFGSFDWGVRDTDGREANKAERIGKKYQWIALHEAIARISDNFHPSKSAFDFECEGYEGPWQLYLRDIDPTCLLRSTSRNKGGEASAWWSHQSFDKWEPALAPKEWLQRTDELPTISSLLVATNPHDGSNWFNLECFFQWKEPVPIGDERYESPNKEIWFKLQGYIVKQTDAVRLVDWARVQDFYNDWMPHSGPESRVFLHEFYWSPAFRYHYGYTQKNGGWTDKVFGQNKELPAKLLVPSFQFMTEHGTHDCSLDSGVVIRLPNDWIVENMGLTMRGDGLFLDKPDSLVAYDPSLREAGTGCLLVRKEPFEAILANHGYTLFWTLLGEKNIYYDRSAVERIVPFGRLVINGGYALQASKITGGFNSSFNDG
jgi:hypothetical protein